MSESLEDIPPTPEDMSVNALEEFSPERECETIVETSEFRPIAQRASAPAKKLTEAIPPTSMSPTTAEDIKRSFWKGSPLFKTQRSSKVLERESFDNSRSRGSNVVTLSPALQDSKVLISILRKRSFDLI